MLGTQEAVFRFGDVEVRERDFRLIKAGEVIPVEPKAFRVLLLLLRNPQKLITKEELLNAVWGETAVSENSLTRSIALLRRLLGEDTHEPRFIETVATVGYRLICPVEIEETAVASSKIREAEAPEIEPITGDAATEGTQQPGTSAPVTPTTGVRPRVRRRRWPWALAVGMVAAIGIAAAWWEWWSTPAVFVVTSIEPLTHNGLSKEFLVTDGSRVYFIEFAKRRVAVLAQVSAGGGETSTIPTPFALVKLHDIAPDRSSLLVSEDRWTPQPSPLWILPLPQGAPRIVGNAIANWATWTSDGKQIIFARGAEIWITAVDGSQMRKLWTAPGPVLFLRASPDGKRMRFTVCEQSGCALWEANTNGSGAHLLLAGWQEHPSQSGGSWTPNGRFYIFGAGIRRGEYSYEDLWLLPERRGWFSRRQPSPVQLTRGPLVFYIPAAFSPDGKTLYAQGVEVRAELVRYDPKTHQTAPYLAGIPAKLLAFSADGQWISYISVPDSSMWRCRTDGSERVQLTSSANSYAGTSRWSPDGSRIAFEWTPLGKTSPKLALISRDGWPSEQVIPDSEDGHSQTDPTWSPDGGEIVFARAFGLMGVERMELLRVDLRTRKMTPVPGSEGLYSPRWSPSGRYLAAFSIDARSIHLFDFQK